MSASTASIIPVLPYECLKLAASPPLIGNKVELQLLTTLKCNLKCTYCSLGVGEVIGSQTEIKYSLDQLEAFVQTHLAGKDVYVTFYGGEPTLNRKMMLDVMQRFPQFRFQLQTNGTLLHRLPDWAVARLSNVLVSIDGGEAITDGYRGRGIWRKVFAQAQAIRARVKGSVTARVTWSNKATTFEELDHLAESFDFLYWQFVADAQYHDSMDARKDVLRQLVAKFFASRDQLYPIVPIMGIVRNKVLPDKLAQLNHGHTQCRAATHLLNVTPDGNIFPCPDMLYDKSMQMGSIQDNWLSGNPLQQLEGLPCSACEAFAWCQGNCMKNLYVAYTKNDLQYRNTVTDPICELVRFLGEEIDKYDPKQWYSSLENESVRSAIADAEIYEYVEVMP